MNYLQDYEICDYYGFPPRRAGAIGMKDNLIKKSLDMIDEVVLHHTDGRGTWDGLKLWYMNPGDPKKVKQFKNHVGGPTHFYVQRNGLIIKAVPLTRWVYHSCSGKRDKKTIAIEVFHKSPDKFMIEQVESVVEIIESLVDDELLNIKTISDHDYRYNKYSRKIKGCIGKQFNYNLLIDLLNKDGYSFDYNFFNKGAG